VRVGGALQSVPREADIVVGAPVAVSLAGEAKWSDTVGLGDLAQLRAATAAVPGTREGTRLALFSRGGFTDELRAVAERERILLLAADDLVATGP